MNCHILGGRFPRHRDRSGRTLGHGGRHRQKEVSQGKGLIQNILNSVIIF